MPVAGVHGVGSQFRFSELLWKLRNRKLTIHETLEYTIEFAWQVNCCCLVDNCKPTYPKPNSQITKSLRHNELFGKRCSSS